MAVDMFMKIVVGGSALDGESLDKHHKGEIEVLGWSWGTSQTGSSHSGPGSGAGKASVQDLTFTMNANKSCANLWQMVCGGTHFDEADLTLRRAGGTDALEYMKVVMKKGLVSNIAFSGGLDDHQSITVSLNFGYVEIHYTPQVNEGSGDAETVVYYDIKLHEIG